MKGLEKKLTLGVLLTLLILTAGCGSSDSTRDGSGPDTEASGDSRMFIGDPLPGFSNRRIGSCTSQSSISGDQFAANEVSALARCSSSRRPMRIGVEGFVVNPDEVVTDYAHIVGALAPIATGDLEGALPCSTLGGSLDCSIDRSAVRKPPDGAFEFSLRMVFEMAETVCDTRLLLQVSVPGPRASLAGFSGPMKPPALCLRRPKGE